MDELKKKLRCVTYLHGLGADDFKAGLITAWLGLKNIQCEWGTAYRCEKITYELTSSEFAELAEYLNESMGNNHLFPI